MGGGVICLFAPFYTHPVDFASDKMRSDLQARFIAGKLEERFSNIYIFSEERPMFEFYVFKNQ